MRRRKISLAWLLVFSFVLVAHVRGADKALFTAAVDSISADELYHHVEVLADDIYEGREAGSRGGHAAAQYIVRQLRHLQTTPGATSTEYVQTFGDNCRNILVVQPG